MKLNKKKVFTLALAICLIAILSFSTLAWFNDSDSVTNEFYVAGSEDGEATPDQLFSVDVDEYIDEDGDGEPDPDPVEDGHEFENIMPGDDIIKKPVVTNTGMYEQWIRLTVTFASKDAWYALQAGNTAEGPLKLLTLDENWADNWIYDGLDYSGDAYVYTYYLAQPLEAGASVNTFTQVNIPEKLNQAELAAISGEEITLKVVADAVQVKNVGAETAKEAFEIVLNGTN